MMKRHTDNLNLTSFKWLIPKSFQKKILKSGVLNEIDYLLSDTDIEFNNNQLSVKNSLGEILDLCYSINPYKTIETGIYISTIKDDIGRAELNPLVDTLIKDTQYTIEPQVKVEAGDEISVFKYWDSIRKIIIEIPLYFLIKEFCPWDIRGTHTLYRHAFTDADNGRIGSWDAYIGMTKRPWYIRYAEHKTSAKNGSHYDFHKKLRSHGDYIHHRVLTSDLSYEQCMELEEYFVCQTLKPVGYNMIPGGFAGLRYLSKLSGKKYKKGDTTENIDKDINGYYRSHRGRNVFEISQEFLNSVSCNGGRFSVEEVKKIRYLNSIGLERDEIAKVIFPRHKFPRKDLVNKLLDGKTYARVA